MKYKNILLTGNINCGKSTLINNVLKDINFKYGGYRTLPYYINGNIQGYYIQGYIDYMDEKELYNPISISTTYKKYIRFTETFDSLGTLILKESQIQNNIEIILLDEIGFLEDESEKFKLEIHKCLYSSKFCLGVLKKKYSEFLDSIREREDTLIINIEEISYEDRLLIKNDIVNYIKDYQLKGVE